MSTLIRNIDELIYRGEVIKRQGRGFSYGFLLWPNLDGLKNFIDNTLDGTKKEVLILSTKDQHERIKVSYYPNKDNQ